MENIPQCLNANNTCSIYIEDGSIPSYGICPGTGKYVLVKVPQRNRTNWRSVCR